MLRVERYSTKSLLRRRQYRFRIVHTRNGEIMAQGEGYNNRFDRDAAVAVLVRQMAVADIEDLDDE